MAQAYRRLQYCTSNLVPRCFYRHKRIWMQQWVATSLCIRPLFGVTFNFGPRKNHWSLKKTFFFPLIFFRDQWKELAHTYSFMILLMILFSMGVHRGQTNPTLTRSVSHISTPWYWNVSCVILYLSDSTVRTTFCARFLLGIKKEYSFYVDIYRLC